MRKLWITILAGLLVFPVLFQPRAQADTPIKIMIDGVALSTDQPPVMVNGRTLVPLRAIFEAFHASIKWDQKIQTVTATKDDTTIVLKIGSKMATINNQSVYLDVPGLNLKGRTMVPTRFVSEALGQEVGWNPQTKVVTITTPAGSTGNVSPVSGITLQDVSDNGDGRDLQVSFVRSAGESIVDHYRVFIVKAGKTLQLSGALQIPASNYSTALVTGANPVLKLTSASRDADGELIRLNQAYTAYVLAVAKGNNTSALSNPSSVITLVNTAISVPENVKVTDVSDYGDGRDMFVSFNKLPDESRIGSYRIFVVKAADYSSFTLAKAAAVASANYTQISKTGSNITQLLPSGARDAAGPL